MSSTHSQTYTLTLPTTGSRLITNRVLDSSEPIFLYHLDESNGMPKGHTATIWNKSLSHQPANWRYSHNWGDWTGAYETAQEALAELEEEANRMADNPFATDNKFARCKDGECDKMVHTSSFVSVLRRAFGNEVRGAMMSCQGGHIMPYQSSDFHRKEDWLERGITAPFDKHRVTGYEVVRFNHVTSHPDAAPCCVGEPHALGGVHIVKHRSWRKPRSYCVEHLLEKAATDFELLQAWQEYQIKQSIRSQWRPQVGDFVFAQGHHGRCEVVKIVGSETVIKFLAKDTREPVDDLGHFITVPLWSLTVAPDK
jgi:hypothetical protein